MSVIAAAAGLVAISITFVAINRSALERDELRELEVVGAWMS